MEGLKGINYFRGGPNISEIFGPGESKYRGGPSIPLQAIYSPVAQLRSVGSRNTIQSSKEALNYFG